MGIQYGRLLVGGLLAGVIVNLFEFVSNTFLLGKAWSDAMRSLGRAVEYSVPQMVAFYIWGFLMGIAAVWLYAAIRPRFGAGPKTATIAGFAVWLIGYVLSSVPAVVLEIFPTQLMVMAMAVGLVEIVLGTIAGAWLYHEAATPEPQMMGAAGAK